MTRPRLAKNRSLAGLPLYPTTVKGTVYYRFKDPATKKFFSLGTDKAAATAAARTLMARRSVDKVEALVRRVDGTRKSAASVCADFRVELGARGLSGKTLADYDNLLERFNVALGAAPFAKVSRADVAAFLAPMPGRQANLCRGLLVQLWRFGVGHGYAEANVAEQTLKKAAKKVRPRLTEDGYALIRAEAPGWLQRAMDVALHGIQRAEDNASLQVSQWDGKAGVLTLTQSKTGAHLAIAAGAQLRAALEACLASEPVDAATVLRCPRVAGDGHRHRHSNVTADVLSHGFAAARDAVPVYRDLPAGAKPSLHELRSLGAALYLWKCRDIDLVQKLLGHKTRQQTLNYLEGHKLPPEIVSSG